MQKIIQDILDKYPTARASSRFSGEHEVYKLFANLKDEISNLEFIKSNPSLKVKFSCGQGNWAAIPWIAILDRRETTSNQRGVYIVILFDEEGKGCSLKLAQGVTDFQRNLGTNKAIAELINKSEKIRSLLSAEDIANFELPGNSVDHLTNTTAKLYESSTVLSKYWPSNEIPTSNLIEIDLETLTDCYDKYIQNRELIDPEDEEDDFNQGRKIWAIAVGENGRLWNEFYEKGIVGIGWEILGDLSKFKSQDEIAEYLMKTKNSTGPFPMNDSLCCYQFVHDMKPGDLVIAKVGRKQILGGGVVISDYIYDPERNEYKNIRKVNWVTKEKNEFPGSGGTIKTLTEISRYQSFKELAESYIADTINLEKSVAEPYTIDDALDDLFMPKEEIEKIIDTAIRKKNIILQGPPGVGKTFVSKRLGYLLMGEKDPSRLEYIQFHQSYSYEDFVQGWRPNSDGGFNLKNGSFYEFCEKARGDLDRTYVFIIDEINRGNLSKIFGELLMLIESDKRGLANAIKLTYSETEADRFAVPENVFLIGLMNTADRSLALVDYALRRRFAFFKLQPQFESEKFELLIKRAGGSKELVDKVRSKIKQLNQIISEQKRDLGAGFEVGHSYFCPTSKISSDLAWYNSVIENEIMPLIEEYWFDDPDKVESLVSELYS